MSQFTWLPFFEEMLSVVCQRYDKDSLCELYHEIFEGASGLSDKFADGSTGPLREIDPLTFTGFHNRELFLGEQQWQLKKIQKHNGYGSIPISECLLVFLSG